MQLVSTENYRILFLSRKYIRRGSWVQFDPEKLRNLPPVFKKNGTITAGNSPALSDGAAALLLTSAAFAQEHKLPILAHIRGFGDAAQVDRRFPQSLHHLHILFSR